MFAADFRKIARDALAGKWTIAVIACLIASLLGAVASEGPEINFNINTSGPVISLKYGDYQIFPSNGGFNEGLSSGFFIRNASFIVLAAIVMVVVFFILGSIIGVGYSRFNLDLVDRQKEPEIGTLFNYFSNWKTAAAAGALQVLLIFLWSLLLIIPGIIASYSYAMTRYILAEHPELTAGEALNRSKEIMYGNRWRLFCLEFSFIGWNILAALTFGIGNLWLNPYKQAATAAFYREVYSDAYPTSKIPCADDTSFDN